MSFKRNRAGTAPVIATMLLVVITLTIVGIVITWGLPLIRDNQDKTTIRTYQRNMNTLEGNLKHCLLQGPGFQLENSFSFVDTEFSMKKDSEIWIVSYSYFPSVNITYTGLDDPDKSFDIDTLGFTGLAGFEMKECKARVEFIDPKPVVEDPIIVLDYMSGYRSPVEMKGFLKVSIIMNETVISEAWKFSMDLLEQTVHTNSKAYDFAISNGALMSSYPTGNEVVTDPLIVENREYGSLSLSMIDMKREGLNRFTSGRYSIGFEVLSTDIISLEDVYNVRIEIKGDWAEAWAGYFNKDYREYNGPHLQYTGFYIPRDRDDIRYLYPKESGFQNDNAYPNNIDLRITRYVVQTRLEKA